MSGFAGVLHLGGGTPPHGLLARLADDRSVHVDGTLGVAGTIEKADGVTLVADARLDARDDLVAALRAAGEPVRAGSADDALLLAAWRVWGERCLEHVTGDYAFLVSDRPGGRLFAARDPFGVRHLYYARHDDLFVFADRIEVLLRDPAVSREPDEVHVADYLLFGSGKDGSATAFRDVRAVPPAHAITLVDGRITTTRHWAAPMDGSIVYRHVRQYADHFREVFGRAVQDRLGGGTNAVFMSGGRDSTAVAAAAVRLGARVHAVTGVYDRLMADSERKYATIAAASLRIPIDILPGDDYRLYDRWEEPLNQAPEPSDGTPFAAAGSDMLRSAAARAPVVLTGYGADAALRESASRLARLLARGRLVQAAMESAQYVRTHRRLPRPGLRTLIRRRRGTEWQPTMPAFLDPDFARRVDAGERWLQYAMPAESSHPLRPEAHALLDPLGWSRIVASNAPSVSGIPCEGRHPFLDTRVLRFLLAIPPALWYNDKGLLRLLLADDMPAEFLRRQKTPLAADPVKARLERFGPQDMQRRHLAPGIERYVDTARLPVFAGGTAPGGDLDDAWLHLRPLNLSIWAEAARVRPDARG